VLNLSAEPEDCTKRTSSRACVCPLMAVPAPFLGGLHHMYVRV
jgi:hypothetical protein